MELNYNWIILKKKNRYFLQKENKSGESTLISHVTTETGCTQNVDEVLSEIFKFYSNLYSLEDVDQFLVEYFLTDVDRLSAEDVLTCEGCLTINECSNTFKNMGHNKSPGSDGLTMEFYFKFFDLIGPAFVVMANNCFFK